MINTELTLKRSTAICRLGPALFKSPESLGIWTEWQIGKWANLRLRFLHMVLNRSGLL